jgi:hypothetical protein
MNVMSYNLLTMPGCAGTMRPIEAWRKKGLKCEDCAWEDYCIDFFDSQVSPGLEYDYVNEVNRQMYEQDSQTA